MASPTRFPSGVSVANRGSEILTEAPIKQAIIPIKASDGTAENVTSFVLPQNAVVLPNVLLNVRKAEVTGTTKTINVGTNSGAGGDADGYGVGLDVATTGLKKATLLKGGVTLGALLFVDSGVAADVANAPEVDISSGGRAVSWTPASVNFAELEADIILEYREVRLV